MYCTHIRENSKKEQRSHSISTLTQLLIYPGICRCTVYFPRESNLPENKDFACLVHCYNASG